jgi:hypothetical protein
VRVSGSGHPGWPERDFPGYQSSVIRRWRSGSGPAAAIEDV